MFFKNHELRIKVAKPAKDNTTNEDNIDRTEEFIKIHDILMNDAKKIAVVAASGYALKRVFDLGSEIAIIAAKAHI